MSSTKLALRQVAYTNKAFWRNPASAGFTFVFPLMFLVIFTTLFGNKLITITTGVQVAQSTFYVATMSAFAVITACYTNIAISVTFQREQGILKRLRGTPLPGRSYLAGRVMHAMIVAAILVTISAVFGRVFYGAALPIRTLPALVLTIAIGAASFAAIALALTCLIPNADAAPAIVNVSILPIIFLSDIFINIKPSTPGWVSVFGNIFPIRHFSEAMQTAYFARSGTGFDGKDMLVVAVWGVAGLLLAIRFFSWEPRK